jgi:DNA repair ATPase RecN
MTTLTPERIVELRKLCEAATPGPWKVFHLIKGAYEVCRRDDYARGGICVPHRQDNAEFIAAAREALPAALDEIEQLRACTHELEEYIKKLKYERNALQKICARRAGMLELSGFHADCTKEEVEESILKRSAQTLEIERQAARIKKLETALRKDDAQALREAEVNMRERAAILCDADSYCTSAIVNAIRDLPLSTDE